MGRFIKLYEDNTDIKEVRKIVDELRKGGVIIYPTDTVYAIGCDIMQPKAVQKVAALKGVRPERALFSIICADISMAGKYTKIGDKVFKCMKRTLPGPFTFILPAAKELPSSLEGLRKTIGVRIPDNRIVHAIVEELGNPLLTTSVKSDDAETEYTTDPELIYEKYGNMVDVVIDGGYGNDEPSTVVDCSDDEPEIIRQGLGNF